MPKIFLIKDRLHQQQLRLQESQSLIQSKNADQLSIGDNAQQRHGDGQEPLSLVAKKRINDHLHHTDSSSLLNKNDSGEYLIFFNNNIKNSHSFFFRKSSKEINMCISRQIVVPFSQNEMNSQYF